MAEILTDNWHLYPPIQTLFHSLDTILDRPSTFRLDLMFSVFLTRELVSILWHSFVHRWNFGDFLFTTGLFIVFVAVFTFSYRKISILR